MSSCVPTHALLSALVRRIRVEGFVPPRSDFAALLALGITRDELMSALESIESPAADEARKLVLELCG